MNVFHHDHYRDILREALLERKEKHGKAFTFEKMARACRVQRSYLSTVLRGSGHLNSDQVFMAAEFLGLSEEEYEYLSVLHEWEKSVSLTRKKKLGNRCKELRDQALQAQKVLAVHPLSKMEHTYQSDFYLDMTAQMIHMALTIERFRQHPDRLMKALGIDAVSFAGAMTKIEKAGLVRFHGKKIEVAQEAFHLPTSSPLYPAYRMMMRLKAMDTMNSKPKEHQYSFSALFSTTEERRLKVQVKFLEFLEWVQKTTQGPVAEDAYIMNFDLVRLTS